MEKRISDLLDGLEADPVPIQERNVVSPEKIKEMTMNQIHPEGKHPGHKKRLARIVLIAAAMVLVLSVTATCVGFLQYERPEEMLDGFFGRDEHSAGEGVLECQVLELDGELRREVTDKHPAWEAMDMDGEAAERLLYPYAYAVDQSVTWENYTLTVEAVIYDKKTESGLLYMSLENPEGMDGFEVGEDGRVMDAEQSAPCSVSVRATVGCTYLDESRSSDTKLYLCRYFGIVESWYELWRDEDWDPEAPRLELFLTTGERRMADDGSCRMETLGAPLTVGLPDTELPGRSFADGWGWLTPIGMQLNTKRELGEEVGVMPMLGKEIGWEIEYMAVRFRDGTEYVVLDGANNFKNAVEDVDRGNIGKPGQDELVLFNSLVDVENVTEIVLDDTVFPVE